MERPVRDGIGLRFQRPDVRDQRFDVDRVELAVVAIRHDREERLAVLVDAGRDRAGDLGVAPVGQRRRRDVARVEVAGHAHLRVRERFATLAFGAGDNRRRVLVPVARRMTVDAAGDVVEEIRPAGDFLRRPGVRQRRRLGVERIGRVQPTHPGRNSRKRSNHRDERYSFQVSHQQRL
jgi:hypothetical protein